MTSWVHNCAFCYLTLYTTTSIILVVHAKWQTTGIHECLDAKWPLNVDANSGTVYKLVLHESGIQMNKTI